MLTYSKFNELDNLVIKVLSMNKLMSVQWYASM